MNSIRKKHYSCSRRKYSYSNRDNTKIYSQNENEKKTVKKHWNCFKLVGIKVCVKVWYFSYFCDLPEPPSVSVVQSFLCLYLHLLHFSSPTTPSFPPWPGQTRNCNMSCHFVCMQGDNMSLAFWGRWIGCGTKGVSDGGGEPVTWAGVTEVEEGRGRRSKQ